MLIMFNSACGSAKGILNFSIVSFSFKQSYHKLLCNNVPFTTSNEVSSSHGVTNIYSLCSPKSICGLRLTDFSESEEQLEAWRSGMKIYWAEIWKNLSVQRFMPFPPLPFSLLLDFLLSCSHCIFHILLFFCVLTFYEHFSHKADWISVYLLQAGYLVVVYKSNITFKGLLSRVQDVLNEN